MNHKKTELIFSIYDTLFNNKKGNAMAWQDFHTVLEQLQFDDSVAGGALVIYKDGKQTVNTAIGNATSDLAWSGRTLSVNFSIGKGVMATLVAILVSKGILDYDEPIGHYWKAFANNGKHNITLRHVLTHTSGLFNITTLTQSIDDLTDWQIMGDLVANMTTDTPKGQEIHGYASAYSALVSGWIIGHVIERVTDESLQMVLDCHLAKPLGLMGQMFYELPSEKCHQVARPVRYFNGMPNNKRKPTLKPDTPEILKTLANLPTTALWKNALKDTDITTANINRLYFDTSKMNLTNYKNALMPNGRDGVEYYSQAVMTAKIPAANGVSTAQALACMYAMHANGGVWQEQVLINPNVMNDLRRIQVDGFDAVMPANMRWRTGFHRLFSLQNTPNAYGHMGYNGSVAFCDPDRHLSFAFIHNFDTTMLNDVRQFALSEMVLSGAFE